MELFARFSHTHIDHTQDNTAQLVVTLKAPTLDWMQKRPQLCVLPVVDLSGSMAGPKLEYAKQSLLKLVDQLTDGDYAGLIGFESHVHMLAKPQKVTPEFKDQLKVTIRKLSDHGSTNFADAMLQALSAVENLDLPSTFLKRIIMFTDGQPTVGVTNPQAILRLLTAQNNTTVGLSAFGYGDLQGSCDQQFLAEFAALGRGNYAFVQNPDDALSAFGKELGGLLSTYATGIHIEIEPANGHHIVKTVTNVPVTSDVTGVHEVKLSDILSEEARHFVFDTRLLKQPKPLPREFTAFNINIHYDVLTEMGTKERRTAQAKAKIHFVKPAEAQKDIGADVRDVVALHQLIRTQLEAEEEAKKGNFAAAAARMNALGTEMKTKGHLGPLADAAFQASLRLGNSANYATGQGYLRSFAAAGTRQYGTSALDPQARAVLSSCDVSTSNQAMDAYAAVFEGTAEAPAPIPSTPNKSG